MMSAILSADDLNDFISPGVACIKPVETLPPSNQQRDSDSNESNEVILDGQQHMAGTAAAPATISLTDCLACSGCVTSAEAVLVSLQSHNEVLGVLDSAPALRVVRRGEGSVATTFGAEATTATGCGRDAACGCCCGGAEQHHGETGTEGMVLVASISPQTRASLAAACGAGVSEKEAGYMLERLFRGPEGLASGGKWGNSFTYVVDVTAAREACLVLGADEVLGERGGQVQRPVITSSCPGWVCYAEKTHAHVLPHLSRVKSPQALTGTLLKTVLSRRLGIPSSRIWHLAVMPCFDKKLEASREELTDAVWDGDGAPGRGVRDVDCVITSKEILTLAEARGIDFFGLPKTPLPTSDKSFFPDPRLDEFLFPARLPSCSVPEAGSSGGNLFFILQTVMSRHAGSRIQTTKGRNADVAEYQVISASGETLFRGARYYGFRNIQNLVRRLKPARPSRAFGGRMVGGARHAGSKASAGCEDAYVEVMACPGGCSNGGGQIGVDDLVVASRRGLVGKPGPREQKAWLAAVDEAYFSADESDGWDLRGIGAQTEHAVGTIHPSYIRDTLAYWSSSTGIDMDRLAFTTFREVVSDVGKDDSRTDTEKAAQLAGRIGGGW